MPFILFALALICWLLLHLAAPQPLTGFNQVTMGANEPQARTGRILTHAPARPCPLSSQPRSQCYPPACLLSDKMLVLSVATWPANNYFLQLEWIKNCYWFLIAAIILLWIIKPIKSMRVHQITTHVCKSLMAARRTLVAISNDPMKLPVHFHKHKTFQMLCVNVKGSRPTRRWKQQSELFCMWKGWWVYEFIDS